tara:strand:+ start:541 stop:780 length:240 start_codon:yes stop_codon:yes gene_type:complete
MNQRANEINLNEDQFERLKSYYIERYVDNMSMKDLIQIVSDNMTDYLYKCSESEVIDDISFYFEDHFDDIVSEVRNGDL